MDCETCQHEMLSELYGELDEASHRALGEHLGGCESCRAKFAGLSQTRSLLATNLVVSAPLDLEARILDAAFPKPVALVIALPSRSARVVSTLGRWAMRPQTAMAAVFLLMVGSSALLLKGRSSRATASVQVSENGGPASAGVASEPGANEARSEASRAGQGAVPVVPGAAARAAPLGLPDDLAAHDRTGGRASGGFAPSDESDKLEQSGAEGKVAAGLAKPSRAVDTGNSWAPAPAANAAAGSAMLSAAQTRSSEVNRDNPSGGAFAAGTTAYNAKRYSDAVALFDSAARNGDPSAALWAARSVREGNGCATALTRYEHVASTASGTSFGNDAIFEAGKCYQALGNLDASSAHFARLQSVSGYGDRATAELQNNRKTAEMRAERMKAGVSAKAAGSPAPAASVSPPDVKP